MAFQSSNLNAHTFATMPRRSAANKLAAPQTSTPPPSTRTSPTTPASAVEALPARPTKKTRGTPAIKRNDPPSGYQLFSQRAFPPGPKSELAASKVSIESDSKLIAPPRRGAP